MLVTPLWGDCPLGQILADAVLRAIAEGVPRGVVPLADLALPIDLMRRSSAASIEALRKILAAPRPPVSRVRSRNSKTNWQPPRSGQPERMKVSSFTGAK